MNLIKKIELTLDKISKPYNYDLSMNEYVIRVIDAWLRQPENDCLRARGDYRWHKMNELREEARDLMQF